MSKCFAHDHETIARPEGMHNFCQISNFLGIFPVLLALKFKLYWIAAAIALSVSLSIIYHQDETNELALMGDMAGCAVMCSFAFFILLNAEYSFTFANLLSLLYALGAVFCYIMANRPGQSYFFWHTGWHALVLYATTLFVYSYVNSTILDESPSRISRPLRPVLETGFQRARQLPVLILRRVRACPCDQKSGALLAAPPLAAAAAAASATAPPADNSSPIKLTMQLH